jgi:hypothetical protein
LIDSLALHSLLPKCCRMHLQDGDIERTVRPVKSGAQFGADAAALITSCQMLSPP